jgi:hypothetical protein
MARLRGANAIVGLVVLLIAACGQTVVVPPGPILDIPPGPANGAA